MDELPKSMRGEENFFDDGDDNIIGRIDAGENFVDAYDLHEVSIFCCGSEVVLS